MMPQNAVKLLFLVVCLTVLLEIEGPQSPGHRRSRSPPRWAGMPFGLSNSWLDPVLSHTRSGAASLADSWNPVRRSGSQTFGEASSSRNFGEASSSRNFGEASSSWAAGPSTSSRTLAPSSLASQPPSILFIMPPQELQDKDKRARAFRAIEKFQRMITKAGDGNPKMTIRQYNSVKTSLMETVRDDCCDTNLRKGNEKCVKALGKFRSIPKNWRGRCGVSNGGGAFAAWCHPWGETKKCSFFMKTSSRDPGTQPPYFGYLHTLADCAAALPEPHA
nr:PREDICTED: uncharacterized protein LOC109033403 [Bemisia tabaci]